MAAIAVFGGVIVVTHLTSMAPFLCTRIWWWDILIHTASRLGVATILYVLNPRLLHSRLALPVIFSMAITAVRTWLEVYERLFADFWVEWPRSVYLEDTAVDIAADTTGVVVFGIVRSLWNRIRRWRDPNRL